MGALSKDRNTKARHMGVLTTYLVAATTKIYNGSLVAVNSTGYLVPAADTAALKVVGRAEQQVDNSAGLDGALSCNVLEGVFRWVNGTATVTQAYVGLRCYVQDDQSVAITSTNDIVAGIVTEIDTSGVWVKTSPAHESPNLVGLVGRAIETVTSGALSVATPTSLVSVTGTQAYTLAAGSFEGQRKSIRVTVAASTPVGTLTPAAFADGTSISLDAVNEAVELEYHATGGWRVVAIIGA
ncbi:MAG: hypothetical protein V2A73_19190, partial [Pseudomonadota bacterium]